MIDWGKIHAMPKTDSEKKSDPGLIPRIHRELLQIDQKKTGNYILKCTKGVKRQFTGEEAQMMN